MWFTEPESIYIVGSTTKYFVVDNNAKGTHFSIFVAKLNTFIMLTAVCSLRTIQREHIILFPWQQRLCECAITLCYTYIHCLSCWYYLKQNMPLRIQVFWDVILAQLFTPFQRNAVPLSWRGQGAQGWSIEDEGTVFSQNVAGLCLGTLRSSWGLWWLPGGGIPNPKGKP
jgi:hypothetical protein